MREIIYNSDGSIKEIRGEEVTPKIRLTKREYRNLFTFQEKVLIQTEAKTDVEVEVILDDLREAEFIDLNNSEVESALTFFVAKNLISEERKNKVLAGEKP